MGITDELREYALGWDERNRVRRDLAAIADRIDAEHEAACAEAYGNGVMSVPIALDESQWVKLPMSEDGDVLHIGELVDEKLPFGGYAAPAPIDTMELSRGASGYRWMVKLDAENRALVSPRLLRHVKPDSWERIMDDAEKLARGDNAAVMELVERCRRLAGEGA